MTGTSRIVDSHFEAAGIHDSDAVVNLFTADAVVVDEGKTRCGRSEIRD